MVVRELRSDNPSAIIRVPFFSDRKEKNVKHEDYFDITQVEGVTPEIIKEYKRLVRRERYLEEIDRKHKTFHYGYEEEVEYLLPPTQTTEDSPIDADRCLHFKLKEALDLLRVENEQWYEAVIAYFYGGNRISYRILAQRFDVSKQTVFLRVQNGLAFLRKTMSEE